MKRYGERRRLPPRGPLRRIVKTTYNGWDGNEYDLLECGHRKLIGANAGAGSRRCDDCRREAEREANTP